MDIFPMIRSSIPTGRFNAACLFKNHAPLEIVELDFPSTLLSKQVLVRNIFSSICGSQLGEIDAKKGPDPYLPHLLGHEAVSEVVAVGDDVTEVKIGERVILHWMKGKGGQAADHSIFSGGTRINAGPITTFSEFSIVSENRCTPVDTSLPLELLPLYGCSITTAYGALKNDIGIRPEDKLLVLGLGPLGMFSLELSKLFGVSQTLGIDIQIEKVEKAESLGFASCVWGFEGESPDLISSFIEASSQSRLVVVETTGSITVIEKAYDFLGSKGQMVLIGVSPFGKKISIDPMPLHFGAGIVGSFGGQTIPNEDIPFLISLAEKSKFRLDILENDFFDLSDINIAIGEMRRGSSKKKILCLQNL